MVVLTRETFDHDGNLELKLCLKCWVLLELGKFLYDRLWNTQGPQDQFGGIPWRHRDTEIQREKKIRDARVTSPILSSSICFLPLSDSTFDCHLEMHNFEVSFSKNPIKPPTSTTGLAFVKSTIRGEAFHLVFDISDLSHSGFHVLGLQRWEHTLGAF